MSFCPRLFLSDPLLLPTTDPLPLTVLNNHYFFNACLQNSFAIGVAVVHLSHLHVHPFKWVVDPMISSSPWPFLILTFFIHDGGDLQIQNLSSFLRAYMVVSFFLEFNFLFVTL